MRGLVLAAGLLEGLDALEEYFTLLAADWGVPTGLDTAGRTGHPADRRRRHLVEHAGG